jgi:hypothetical protein
MRFLAVLALALACALTSLPVARAQATQSQTVYNIEVIVFRNQGGGGGQEDWTARSVARGPDTPESPFAGRFVQSIPS